MKNDNVNIFYVLLKTIFIIFLFLPVVFLITILEKLNSKNKFDEILNDLHSFLDWMTPKSK